MNALLAQEPRLLRIKEYGPGAERLSDDQLALLQLEPGVCSMEVAPEAAQELKSRMVRETGMPIYLMLGELHELAIIAT